MEKLSTYCEDDEHDLCDRENDCECKCHKKDGSGIEDFVGGAIVGGILGGMFNGGSDSGNSFGGFGGGESGGGGASGNW